MSVELHNFPLILEALAPRLIQAAAIVLATFIGVRLIRLAAKRLKNRIGEPDVTAGRAARLVTLISLGSQVSRGAILVLAVFTLLGTFGVELGPIITSLGVVGLAISLGAQTLIKDYFGGLMILIEDQYVVGDWVTIGPVSGAVERLSLRLTTLRDVNGKLHVVPNGDVRIVTNASRDWSLAIVDINLALDSDLDRALVLLEQATICAAQDPGLSDALLESPQVQGWNKLLDWAIQVRLSARTKPSQRIAVEIMLRRCALEALQNGQVQLARPLPETRAV